MKTPKQLETVELAKAYVKSELDRLPDLAGKLVQIMKSYEPLLGKDGHGNTHEDNMEIRAYAKFVADQIRIILYNPLISEDVYDVYTLRDHLYETYFKDPEIVAWRDILGGII